jgi:hypothetical protein
MSLTDEVSGRIPHKKRAWVEEQLGDEADEFRALLADPKVLAVDLCAALERRGMTIPHRTMYEWCIQARKAST